MEIHHNDDMAISLDKILLQEQNIYLVVPCPDSVSPHWNIDIANEYLAALYVGESLAQYCPNLNVHLELSRDVLFNFKSSDIIDKDMFTQKLIELSKGFRSDEYQRENEYNEDNNDYDDFLENLADFLDHINEMVLKFPELADKYMANYIVGIEQLSINEDEMEQIYFLYPERRYQFWRSFTSKHLGYDLYVSSRAWIIPHDLNKTAIHRAIAEPLMKFGGFTTGLPTLYDAQWVSMRNMPPIVFNEFTMACFPKQGIREAQECAASIWQGIMQYNNQEFQNKDASRIVYNLSKNGLELTQNDLSVKLSEDGYIMVVSDLLAQYIFFKETYYKYSGEQNEIRTSFLEQVTRESYTLWDIPIKEQKPFWDTLDQFSETLGKLEGNPTNISLDWKKLTDETFELLCYDIISQLEKFDPETIRKLGKSHSRDGGRDLEVFTRPRLNNPSTKWFVQSKLLGPGKSLPASKLLFAEMLMQYGGKGICIMTNALIDSTLHDRLEGSARTMGIEFDEWDGLRIERILAKPRFRNIRVRYFSE